MREVIAVCRSSKRSRVKVASTLDRYFWRIGDRTWRGRASNACLDRVARELRAQARRNTAVVIHEIRSARESRIPILRIGSRKAFSPAGLVPIASHAGRAARWPPRPERDRTKLAILNLAALFHDLGKATCLFQNKLRLSLTHPKKIEADAVRHELVSATVWDQLFGNCEDAGLIDGLRDLTPAAIDQACKDAIPHLRRLHRDDHTPLDLDFAGREGLITHAVGMLVLTHHRLPAGGSDHLRLRADSHVRHDATLTEDELKIAPGVPFWHGSRWLARLHETADDLRPGVAGLDMTLRTALMLADHLGSAFKQPSDVVSDHLGNTLDGQPADSLDRHVGRVLQRLPGSFDLLHRHRERYPALAEDATPIDIACPQPVKPPFDWQARTALAARELCALREGGFFACLLAGTGTGKTRAAPTVLAAAAFGDWRPERRFLRFSLALGLRTLAHQSAQDYVADLRFSAEDIAVLVGEMPIAFRDGNEDDIEADGSASLVTLPRWLRVEQASGCVPTEGSADEADWLRRLSCIHDSRLPATLDLAIEKAGQRGVSARKLIASPILVGTIDHLMAVAEPGRSRHLFQAVRVQTADLIIDEIDQYDPEDLTAIGRLIYQAAAGGRRVVIMSATVTIETAEALHAAYRAGWRDHASATGVEDHVNLLCAGDAAVSCIDNHDGADFGTVFATSRDRLLDALRDRPAVRRARILPPCDGWDALIARIDHDCHQLHRANATVIGGMPISIGFIRLTRISHTAALAAQLPAGPSDGILRLKLCLHARFPRLHRQWIEHELKRALTRKGTDPDAGLRTLCEREGLFDQARDMGCHAIEIVLITSPVIETGNDLDFDWAMIDPISLRSVVQAAGRVRRHRVPLAGTAANLLILGRSLIAMCEGKLVWPGIETRRHQDTGVDCPSLSRFGGRHFAELAAPATFERIDASTLLDADGSALHAAETDLLVKMLALHDAPLDLYLKHSTARLNLRMTRTRRFRRQTTHDILYVLHDSESNLEWHIDFEPASRHSKLLTASKHGLTCLTERMDYFLFPDLTDSALRAAGIDPSDPDPADMRRLMRVRVPEYDSERADPVITCHLHTGFTRGTREDLFSAFGKNK